MGVLPNVFLQLLNIKSRRVKLINFLGDFSVHYAALFINRIIPMMDFATFFDASRATLIPGTLATLNLPIKSHLSSG